LSAIRYVRIAKLEGCYVNGANTLSQLGTRLDGPEQAPVKARAVEYVRICSLYVAGFFYVPGTDACIKIGGHLRADTTFNGAPMARRAWVDCGQHNRFADNFVSRSRLALTIDTRTATEYGVVRASARATSNSIISAIPIEERSHRSRADLPTR
jgi:Porin subfamily